MSLEYPSQSWLTIRDTVEGFGPRWPWASCKTSVSALPYPATPIQSLEVWWVQNEVRGGNLPSRSLLLGGPLVEGATRPSEAS